MLPPAHSPSHRDGASGGTERGLGYDRANVSAQLDIVALGYADDRVASTVVLVRDADAFIVIDPGMAASRDVILGPLEALGVSPSAVSDVIFSHHHPDHTLNAALFPTARFHDHWAIYQGDVWTDRPAEGYEVSPSVRLLETPGHTREDITTLVRTERGLVACTHLWWSAEGPEEDPLATDQALLRRSRARVLSLGRSHRSWSRPSLRATARRLSRARQNEGGNAATPARGARVARGPISDPWPPTRRNPARRHAAIGA